MGKAFQPTLFRGVGIYRFAGLLKPDKNLKKNFYVTGFPHPTPLKSFFYKRNLFFMKEI
jgi:hypothetical protein